MRAHEAGKKEGTRYRVGVPGMADIGGWIENGTDDKSGVISAVPFQMEVKTGSADLGKPQKNFMKMCEKTGCIYLVAYYRKPEDIAANSGVTMGIVSYLDSRLLW